MPPVDFDLDEERREKVVRLSRERYCRPREIVEDKILRWSESKKLTEGKNEKKDYKKSNNQKSEKKPDNQKKEGERKTESKK
jgi:hypothetical protein